MINTLGLCSLSSVGVLTALGRGILRVPQKVSRIESKTSHLERFSLWGEGGHHEAKDTGQRGSVDASTAMDEWNRNVRWKCVH